MDQDRSFDAELTPIIYQAVTRLSPPGHSTWMEIYTTAWRLPICFDCYLAVIFRFPIWFPIKKIN
jgi:hypothetical protein